MILRLIFIAYLSIAEVVFTIEVTGFNSTNVPGTTNSSNDTPVSWINKALPTRRQWGPIDIRQTTVDNNENLIEVSPLPMLSKTNNSNFVHNYVLTSNPSRYYPHTNPPANNNMFNWNTRPATWQNMFTTPRLPTPPSYITKKRPWYSSPALPPFTTQKPYNIQSEVSIKDIILNPDRYQGVCDVYLKNLLRMWKIISQFISIEDNSNVDITQLPNMFKLLAIYIRIKNDNLDPISNNNLRNIAMNILTNDPGDISSSNPYAININPIRKPDNNFPSSNLPINVEIPGDKTQGLSVSAPVPQSKCQEMALESLVETFRKLYQEYMKHLVECEQKLPYLGNQQI